MRSIMDGPDHTLPHNFPEGSTVLEGKECMSGPFVEQAIEDFPDLLQEAFIEALLHSVLWALFLFHSYF